jgi:hypothetical protein
MRVESVSNNGEVGDLDMDSPVTNRHSNHRRQQYGMVVLLSWAAAVLFSAWAANGPIHRSDIAPFWNFEFFMMTLMGPLAVFFGWPGASAGDYIIAILVTVALAYVTLRLLRRPDRPIAFAFIALMVVWILCGLGITYAWV